MAGAAFSSVNGDMTAEFARLTETDIDRQIARDTGRLRAKGGAFLLLGRDLEIPQLIKYGGSDFVRLAYSAALNREPTSAESIAARIELDRGTSKLEFLRALRFSEEGRKSDAPRHRFALWRLQLRYRVMGFLRLPRT